MLHVLVGREDHTYGEFQYDGQSDAPRMTGDVPTLTRILALKTANQDMGTFLRGLSGLLQGALWASVREDVQDASTNPHAFPALAGKFTPAVPGDYSGFPDYPTKFNPYHAQDGRFTTGGGNVTGAAGASASSGGKTGNALADTLVQAGGFTYQPHGREHFPSKGLALSIYPERSVVISGRAIKREDLRKFLDDNKDLLKDRSNYFGAWNDVDHNRIFLDVSKVVKTRAEADRLCRQYKQRAYFDLGTFDTVTVLSEGESHVATQAKGKKAANQDGQPAKKTKPAVHVIPRDATDAELDAIVAKLNAGKKQ